MFLVKNKKYFFHVLSGFKKLRKEKNLDIFSRINSKFLSTEPYKIDESLIEIFGINKLDSVRINQVFLNKILNLKYVNFRESLCESISTQKKFAFPMPYKWAKTIEKEIPLNRFYCSLLFFALCFKEFLKGIFFFVSRVKNIFLKKNYFEENNTYIVDVKSRSITPNKKHKNLLNWFINNFLKNDDKQKYNIFIKSDSNNNYNIDEYRKNIRILNKDIFDFKISLLEYLNFAVFFLKIFLYLFYYFIIKKNLLILIFFKDILESNFIKLFFNSKKSKFLFSMMYEKNKLFYCDQLEKKHHDVILYYYSTNCYNFSNREAINNANIFWNKIFVMSQFQKDFLEKQSKKKEVFLFDKIDWFDQSYSLDNASKDYLALFDMPSYRDLYFLRHYDIGFEDQFYSQDNILELLENISSISKKYKIPVYYKSKCIPQQYQSKKFKENMKKICKSEYFHLIPSNVAPVRLIENSQMVISMPYSTPGVIARNMGKKTFYYSNKKINYELNYNIKILNNLKDLEKEVVLAFNKY